MPALGGVCADRAAVLVSGWWPSCAKVDTPAGFRSATGRGPAWLRRLTGGQESGSSNLPVPTVSSAPPPSVLVHTRLLHVALRHRSRLSVAVVLQMTGVLRGLALAIASA